MIGVVLSVVAYAAPPLPAYPEPPQRVPNECPAAVGLDYGRPVPASVAVDGRASCAATVVPVSMALDLLAVESWATACREQYTVVVAGYEVDMANMTAERDQWKTLAEAKQAEVAKLSAWSRRPVVNLVVGATATAVLVGGGVVLVSM